MLLMQNAFTRGKTTILPTPHPLIPPAAFPNQKFRSEWFKKKKKESVPLQSCHPFSYVYKALFYLGQTNVLLHLHTQI